ncbi:MAG: hypothetical protein CMB57_06390 [Euryarchaeota archaeon]|nr:hypothetical protein [Euryarchaeota archaeon]|tara:strand:+ start:2753 stop:3637 length:885 start_codon:yes stop_codon:yes gene_type:complete
MEELGTKHRIRKSRPALGRSWRVKKEQLVTLQRLVLTAMLACWTTSCLLPVGKKEVVVIMACTKSLSTWGIGQDAVNTILVPSVERTVTRKELNQFDVKIILGFDSGDSFWEQEVNRGITKTNRIIPVSFVRLHPRRTGVVPFNELARRAQQLDADFFVRVNDDTEFLNTGWLTNAIEEVNNLSPSRVGAIGPHCLGGTRRDILTHDMVHRKHLQIFETYYPTELDNWWIDDWITSVYFKRAKIVDAWKVRHHTKTFGTRYLVNMTQHELLDSLVLRGQSRLNSFLDDYAELSK